MAKQVKKQDQQKAFNDELSVKDCVEEIIQNLENAASMCEVCKVLMRDLGYSTDRVVATSQRLNELLTLLRPYLND